MSARPDMPQAPAPQLRVIGGGARPLVTLRSGELPGAVAAILAALRADGSLYERGGALVRVLDDGSIVDVAAPWLRTHIERTCRVRRLTSDGEPRPGNITEEISRRVLAARGEWGLPVLAGVTRHQIMRADGSILATPGYDSRSGLLYLGRDEPAVPELPHALDDAELRAALVRVWEPLSQFPYDSPQSRGVMLAALLTTVCRPALPTAPAVAVTAPAAGSGKSYISECLMLLADAAPAALSLPSADPAEAEKRIVGALATGRRGLTLDNLTGVVTSDSLCSILTSSAPEVRILGSSEVRALPARTLIILNGNNITMGGDLYRRVLPIRLDAACERPEAREFPFDPRERIAARLASYRHDLLCVMMTYQAAGATRVAAGALGSFGVWERLVRQCVCWLIARAVLPVEMVDPLVAMAQSRADDPRVGQHAALCAAWAAKYGDGEVRVADLALAAADPVGVWADPADAPLREVLREIAGDRAGRFGSRVMSWWLRDRAGVIVDGLWIERARTDHSHGSTWRVARTTTT